MNDYPALLELEKRTIHPLGSSESFLVGRNETADVCVLDPFCSRHHFRIIRRESEYQVERLNARNPTYLNGQPVWRLEALEHGSSLQAGHTLFKFLLHPQDEVMDADGAVDPVPVADPLTVLADKCGLLDSPVRVPTFPLSGTMVIGRAIGSAQIHLPHPQVSREHARITLHDKSATLVDLNSANGTFVNGEVLRGPATLRQRDQIDIGPYALIFTGKALVPRPRIDNVELVARRVTRVVKDRESGQQMTLLDDITLVIRPREFVCILGPSGSGKSTLLSALSGRGSTAGGAVLLNGRDLHANFEALKQDIAVVPQKDVLHDTLRVQQALWYTAKLRLPPDTSPTEIEAALREMLETVGLAARRATVIRNLSGGQVKRASLANEILCKPSLLFLDEVTSGLDEQTDREVMNLFRSLADTGKTVVCITHSLANVERTCHLVVILTPGGKLAFVGKPSEALGYFEIERLGDIYERLAKQPPEHWQRTFRESPLWGRYVSERMPPDTAGQRHPEPFRANQSQSDLRQFLRQTALLTARYAEIWRGDTLSLLAMAGQALAVAVLLGLLFGDLDKVSQQYHTQRSVSLVFLLAVSSYWFGCNNAAKEIVKERTIFRRERDFNLRIESYYASKLLLLTSLSALQTLLLFGVVCVWCHPPGWLAAQLLVLLTLALAGVTLGLAISAFAATEEMAITLIPMAVIPQIILSGQLLRWRD